MEVFYRGTEVKFSVKITANNFDMQSDDWKCELKRHNTTVATFTKESCIMSGSDYVICLDTTDLPLGKYDLVATAFIPDQDFPDAFRTEIYKTDLFSIWNA